MDVVLFLLVKFVSKDRFRVIVPFPELSVGVFASNVRQKCKPAIEPSLTTFRWVFRHCLQEDFSRIALEVSDRFPQWNLKTRGYQMKVAGHQTIAMDFKTFFALAKSQVFEQDVTVLPSNEEICPPNNCQCQKIRMLNMDF